MDSRGYEPLVENGHLPSDDDVNEEDITIDSEGEELPHPTYGAPSPPLEETSLEATINDLSVESRTSLLQDIGRQVKDAEALASSRLLAPIDGSTGKRKAFETCKHCKQEHAVTENHIKACRYHPGQYEHIQLSWTNEGILRQA